MSPEYKNGKIAGMMLAGRIIQDWYENNKNYLQGSDARELFAKECAKHGFDLFAYLRGDLKITYEVGPPPIHEHFNDETQQDELCGRVFCPYGFVGVSQRVT